MKKVSPERELRVIFSVKYSNDFIVQPPGGWRQEAAGGQQGWGVCGGQVVGGGQAGVIVIGIVCLMGPLFGSGMAGWMHR